MTDTQQEQLRVRVARALLEADKADALMRDGEYLTATQLARRAAESLLTLVAVIGGHMRPEDRREDLHLEQLSHILRRADVLPKRTGDHVETVKRIGNRAAHPQASLSDEVTAHDAEGALHALDEVVRWFRERVPAELLPPPVAVPAPSPAPPTNKPPPKASKPAPSPGRPWLRNVALAAAALAAPVVGFGAMVWVLGIVGPSNPTGEPAPVVAPPAALEADPAEDAPMPALDAPAAAERVEAIRMRLSADLDLTPDVFGGLGCSDLARARNWLWVRHGYVLKDASERAAFGGLTADARPDATSREIRRDFSTHDQINQSLLEQALRSGHCPCPQTLRPDRPCPE